MHKTIRAVGAVALVGAAALATTSHGATVDPPRTLSLLAADQRCAGVDAGGRTDHLGALTSCSATLRQQSGSAVVGRARWLCTYLGSERAGDDCVATVRLSDGALRVGGELSHTGVSTWIVAGGTGAYAGARGTVRVHQIDDDRTAATIELLP